MLNLHKNLNPTQHDIGCKTLNPTQHEIGCESLNPTQHDIGCETLNPTQHEIGCETLNPTQHYIVRIIYRSSFSSRPLFPWASPFPSPPKVAGLFIRWLMILTPIGDNVHAHQLSICKLPAL
jgi:hypothetical protein